MYKNRCDKYTNITKEAQITRYTKQSLILLETYEQKYLYLNLSLLH